MGICYPLTIRGMIHQVHFTYSIFPIRRRLSRSKFHTEKFRRPDMASIPQAHQFRNVPPTAPAFRNESTVASKKKKDNELATSKTKYKKSIRIQYLYVP